jgi:hypothetical protein
MSKCSMKRREEGLQVRTNEEEGGGGGEKNGEEEKKISEDLISTLLGHSTICSIMYVLTNDSGEPAASTFTYTLKMVARGPPRTLVPDHMA